MLEATIENTVQKRSRVLGRMDQPNDHLLDPRAKISRSVLLIFSGPVSIIIPDHKCCISVLYTSVCKDLEKKNDDVPTRHLPTEVIKD